VDPIVPGLNAKLVITPPMLYRQYIHGCAMRVNFVTKFEMAWAISDDRNRLNYPRVIVSELIDRGTRSKAQMNLSPD